MVLQFYFSCYQQQLVYFGYFRFRFSVLSDHAAMSPEQRNREHEKGRHFDRLQEMLARNSNNRLVVVKTAYAEWLSGQGKRFLMAVITWESSFLTVKPIQEI